MLKIQKRLGVPARAAHVLLRELLIYALGWVDVYSDAGTGSFGLVASGTDGETDVSLPTTFTAASATFSVADIGRYLVLGGANTPQGMRGIHRIVSVLSSTTVVVSSGLYGSQFSTALNVAWRVVNPTLNTDATEFTVRGPAGTGSPAWEARFFISAVPTNSISIQVGPWGGYSNMLGWTQPVTATHTVLNDSVPMWYFHVTDEAIILFTENTAGSGMYQMAYVGTGVPRRPDIDDHFAVLLAGTASALGTVSSIAADNVTQVDYQAAIFLDPSAGNMTTALANSPFDLRRDVLEVSVSSTTGGLMEIDRGTLRGLAFVSDLVSYRSFVDNGRIWLSLGGGLALAWDGSLSA